MPLWFLTFIVFSSRPVAYPETPAPSCRRMSVPVSVKYRRRTVVLYIF